jgi:hypothetical protein
VRLPDLIFYLPMENDMTQYEEHIRDSAFDNSRWDGFDRGDADWDYDAERLAQNEEFEAEMNAEVAA